MRISSAEGEWQRKFWGAAPAGVLASIVEFVEALTIVLAAGMIRQWRSIFIGVVAEVVVLSLVVGVFGSAIVLFMPSAVFRLVVGGFLVIYGLHWLGLWTPVARQSDPDNGF